MLGIRDILERIRILRFVPLTNWSGCRSGRPENVRIRIRNTRSFTSLFKDKKVIMKLQIYNTLEIKVHYFCKVFFTIFAWWWKDPKPDPYLWLKDPDADPGGPTTYGSGAGCGSGSSTLIRTMSLATPHSQYLSSGGSNAVCSADHPLYRAVH